jgi:hypothetical protein
VAAIGSLIEVGLIFVFPIDTASVTALTQISVSMVVPSSPTMQSLMSRPSRAKITLAGEYQRRFGIESDHPPPPGPAEIAQLNTNE